jgi:hypothetical protein
MYLYHQRVLKCDGLRFFVWFGTGKNIDRPLAQD